MALFDYSGTCLRWSTSPMAERDIRFGVEGLDVIPGTAMALQTRER